MKSGSLRIKVLDAGCADGVLSGKVDFEKHGASLYGFDIATDMIELAKKTEKYVDLKVSKGTIKGVRDHILWAL